MNKVLLGLSAIALSSSMSVAMAGDAAAGKAAAASCAGCHGGNGISMVPTYPNLAGQKEAYLAKQLHNFKSGARKDPTMQAMAGGLSDDAIANIAAYFSSLK